jgi:anti-sigma-K factor RskA
MNIREYISSGILESYVLGTASPEEIKEVEKYASMYPEIKAEFEEIEKAMNGYSTEHSVEPPSYLKNKILAKISGETGGALASDETITRPLYQQAPQRADFFYWSVAATFLLLVSTGFAIYFALRINRQDIYIDNMAKANNVLCDSIRAISSNITQMQNDMAILKDPMYKIVDLKGQKAAPDAKAMVCWCPMDKKVYVEIDKLPPAPQGMQYQLWAIVDGKPISEGMLTAGTGLHPMKDVDNAQAFAVTLEKQGGSPEPKGDMYAMGTI